MCFLLLASSSGKWLFTNFLVAFLFFAMETVYCHRELYTNIHSILCCRVTITHIPFLTAKSIIVPTCRAPSPGKRRQQRRQSRANPAATRAHWQMCVPWRKHDQTRLPSEIWLTGVGAQRDDHRGFPSPPRPTAFQHRHRNSTRFTAIHRGSPRWKFTVVHCGGAR